MPAPQAFHKPPIIIYQGVAPPLHVYEQPADAAPAKPTYNAQAKSDTNVADLISSASETVKDWATKVSSQVSQSATVMAKSQPANKAGEDSNQAQIVVKLAPRADTADVVLVDTNNNSGKGEDTSVKLSASVSVGSDKKETLKPGIVLDVE